ncbi:hypothetical protein [Ekhidna sp.]|uniref:hypothetical protein n=1 Tax=Ekhidna sp. TaxID=2608089 RepID=UPI003C7EBAC2
MQKFKSLHLWMIIPLLLIQLGIFRFYWPKFTTTTWEFHIHYWLVTLWFILVIIQPYLISIKSIEKHRVVGMLGLSIAGGVLFTSLSLLDVPLRIISNLSPDQPGPPPQLFYGTLVIEFILGLLFGLAVVKAIINRKDLQEHAWWMICSVFYLMMPGLGRGMIVLWRSLVPIEHIKPFFVGLSAELIFVPLLLLFASKFGRIRHPATIIGLLTVLLRLLRFPIGSSEFVQNLVENMIKWR